MVNTSDHAIVLPRPEELRAPWWAAHMRRRAMLAAGITLALVAIAFLVLRSAPLSSVHFFRAWLVGFMFCAGLTLGSMALLMLQHVTGGKWGLVMRRIFEASSRCLWLLALYFVPVWLGMRYLYPWTTGQGLTPHGEHALHVRHAYLNPTMFTLRAAIYFAVWGVFIWLLNRWSLRQDQPFESIDEANDWRLRYMRLGAGGLLVYAISISLAAVDWVMSLDAIWYSTIWGMLYMVGQTLLAMSFSIVVLVMLARYEPMKSLLRKTELHDNGKLLLAFVMLYTYLAFSQFIIIWSGNLTEEIPWYLARIRNGWRPVFIAIAVFHFAVPFLLLLNRNLKKHGPRLMAVALMLMVARYADLYWHIVPNFGDVSWPKGHFSPNLFDVLVPLAMVFVWMAAFFWHLQGRPIMPLYHPLLPQLLEKSHGTH